MKVYRLTPEDELAGEILYIGETAEINAGRAILAITSPKARLGMSREDLIKSLGNMVDALFDPNDPDPKRVDVPPE